MLLLVFPLVQRNSRKGSHLEIRESHLRVSICQPNGWLACSRFSFAYTLSWTQAPGMGQLCSTWVSCFSWDQPVCSSHGLGRHARETFTSFFGPLPGPETQHWQRALPSVLHSRFLTGSALVLVCDPSLAFC